jgi:competence protein ComEC
MLGLGAFVAQELACAAGGLLAVAAVLLLLAPFARGPRWASVALCGAALAIGAGAGAVERRGYDAAGLAQELRRLDADAPVRVEGRLRKDPETMGERPSLLIESTSLEISGELRRTTGGARISVGGSSPLPGLQAGDEVSVWTTLRAPRGFGNPGSPDVVSRARRGGMHALGSCKTALLVRRLSPARGLVVAAAGRFRAWARARLCERVPPGSEQALVRAMVLGDRSGLDPETEESFRIAGTYHVLALSGAQVALVAGALLWLLRRLEVPRGVSAVLVTAALVFYAVLVGGDVPIVRAVVMALALLLGRALDLDADLPNLLGLAAFGLLVDRPSSIGDVSFQLSFGATLAIVLLAPPFATVLPRLPLRMDLALAASVAAQVALAPLLALHFHRMAPAALLLNLVAVPLSGGVLLVGALVLAMAPVSALLAGWAGDLAWLVAHALLRSADVVRLVPALDVRVRAPSLAAGALYAAGLWLLVRRGGRGAGWLGVASGLALILAPTSPPADGRLHVTVLDVGQGDAIVVRSPLGRAWLVDAGVGGEGRLDMGETVVAPYLWWLGASRLEGFVLSHAHPDHVGGASAVLRALGVERVWEGPAPRRDANYAAFDGLLRELEPVRLCVVRGYRSDWDGVVVEVLAPEPPPWAPHSVRNDDSLVLSLSYGDVSLLLAGDVERAGEARIGTVRVDALKVPHHGSRTSSSAAFLESVRPRVAIVSAGFRNRFGHPHPDVLERYRRVGCRVYRTDRDGAVELSTDGRTLAVTTFRGRMEELPIARRSPRGL